jgi:hypothetical protein
MCQKAIFAVGWAIISSYLLQTARSTRIQPKELFSRVEIHKNGLEGDDAQSDAQKSYILLHDSPKTKKEPTPEQSKKLKATAMLLAAKLKDAKLKDGRPLNSSSSFISRIETSERGATSLHNEDVKTEASEATVAESTAKTESQAETGIWAKLPILLQAVLVGHLPVAIVGEYVWYCSIGIFAMLFLSCSCCCVDWLKTIQRHYKAEKVTRVPPPLNYAASAAAAGAEAPKRKATNEQGRNQYKHKGRVIYEWQQTSTSMMVFTKLPEGLNKKTIEVKIWPRHLKIGRVGKVPFLKEELFSLVDVAESTWDILGNGELAISLRKSQSMEWPCVLRAHHPDKVEAQ